MKVDLINSYNTNFMKSDFDIKKELEIHSTPYERRMNLLSDEYSIAHENLTKLRMQKKLSSKEYMKELFKLEKWLEKSRKAIEKEYLHPVKKITQKPWWKRLLHF